MPSYNYNYCPYCGSTLSYVNNHYRCLNDHVIYMNSAPAVGAIIYDGGSRVLLTRRASNPYKGQWDVPGGFLEYGEDPEAGIRREIIEELGIEITIEEFLGHYISLYAEKNEENGRFVLNMFYLVTANVSNASASDDVDAFSWFEITKLPQNLAFPVNRLVLDRVCGRILK